MSISDLLAALDPLPAEAQVPVGWVKEQIGMAEEKPAVDDEPERTLRMWEERATLDLCRNPWPKAGATALEERA